jgi:hypothetical protein
MQETTDADPTRSESEKRQETFFGLPSEADNHGPCARSEL